MPMLLTPSKCIHQGIAPKVLFIELVCVYNNNIDNPYHTGQNNPPGMEKVVYIVCTYTGYNTWLLDSRKAWVAKTLRLNGFSAEAYRGINCRLYQH